MKRIIVLLSFMLLTGVEAFAGSFCVEEDTTLRSAVDAVLLQSTSDVATLQDGALTYKVVLQKWNHSCRTGVLWTQDGNSAPVSICFPKSKRQ